MDQETQAQKRREITEFRYALVAELANPYLSTAQVSELMSCLSGCRREQPVD